MARSTHPILTDLVLSAMSRITLVDDLIDVLQEGLGATDPEALDGFFDDACCDRWEEADIDDRKAIILEYAASGRRG